MSDDIRVLLAEDSPTARRYLAELIGIASDMIVVGEAQNGLAAVQMVADLRPDVVSMDINMPELDGLEATRRIMMQTPTPIVVVSELLEMDVQLSLRAIEAGALAVVGKPVHRDNPAFEAQHHRLLTTLRAMAQVKVISRRSPRQVYPMGDDDPWPEVSSQAPSRALQPELIVIGASTGGPSALLYLLQELPETLTVPIVIAQHMPNEFINGLMQWLNNVTHFNVMIANDQMWLEKGMVVLVPGNANLTVTRNHQGNLLTRLQTDGDTPAHYLPSIDTLFESVAEVVGPRAVGIILTGMGNDGARGLLAIRQAGGYTLVQDESSSTVFGMPRAAIALGAADQVIPLANLASKIKKML
ncbi:MAG: chemotaxis-specific protein-glutamate methyltransferase CheB [Anaerolineae bacterium]